MDLDWLRDFIALAEQGNFSRAADARHVTQPAFSRRVRALEDWIGTPLFVRSAQGAVLSTAGEAFRPLAADLMARLERARRETLAVGEQQTTSLSIAATHVLSFTFFPRWINQQVDLLTLGKLNLVSDTMEACEQAMLSGEVHFLLCHWRDGMKLNLDPDRYCSIRVGQDALTAVSAPDEQGRPMWRIPGRKEAPTRLLGYSPASGLGRILASQPSHASQDDGIETVFTSHLAATLLVMARDGQGAAWLPLSVVKDHLEAGRLVKAAGDALDLAIDIRLFRSPDCRNKASDELWELLGRTESSSG